MQKHYNFGKYKHKSWYLEHLLTTTLATGESSAIQLLSPETDLPASSNSSLNESLFPTNHLNDPSPMKSSNIFLVLFTIAIFSSSNSCKLLNNSKIFLKSSKKNKKFKQPRKLFFYPIINIILKQQNPNCVITNTQQTNGNLKMKLIGKTRFLEGSSKWVFQIWQGP